VYATPSSLGTKSSVSFSVTAAVVSVTGALLYWEI
jgi:hypothetical protein